MKLLIKESKSPEHEYVAYYTVSGYDIDEQEDNMVDSISSYFDVIDRYGAPDINCLFDKIQFGIHSNYKNEVDYDFVHSCFNDMGATQHPDFELKQIKCPNLHKDEIYYHVAANEFISADEAEELWQNGFIGWNDSDYPGTFKAFLKDCYKSGDIRDVQFL